MQWMYTKQLTFLSASAWISIPNRLTILYILIGLASYLIHRSNSKNKETALIIYYFQLLINFAWPIAFLITKVFY
ncbi:MAG: tryptophan-rich sensory protein [Thomasclavelia ramosa]